jgi:transposase-like protein
MAAQKKYPDELRERAVKLLFEVREREGKGRGELARVARQLGVRARTSLEEPTSRRSMGSPVRLLTELDSRCREQPA